MDATAAPLPPAAAQQQLAASQELLYDVRHQPCLLGCTHRAPHTDARRSGASWRRGAWWTGLPPHGQERYRAAAPPSSPQTGRHATHHPVAPAAYCGLCARRLRRDRGLDDNLITQDEFCTFFKDYGVGHSRLQEIFASIDKDRNGYEPPQAPPCRTIMR